MQIYFAGVTSSVLVDYEKYFTLERIKRFSRITFPQVTDIEIGSTYLLLWQSEKLFISNDPDKMPEIMEVELPNPDEDCKFVVPHYLIERISILTRNNVLWEYDINGNIWELINIFKPKSSEHAVKIIHCGYNMLLTNLGRLLNMDNHQPIGEYNAKFIDIAYGVEHVVMLRDNFHVYVSIVIVHYLQNGNTKPECILGPDLIAVLSERKVVQIAAGGWHCAAITEEGHLYTWGCNKHGELGLNYYEYDISIPQLVRFRNDNTNIEVKVKKVQCGNKFTVCLTDDGTLWGTGDNSYGQLGHDSKNVFNYPRFIALRMDPLYGRTVKDFKCNEKGTAIITE